MIEIKPHLNNCFKCPECQRPYPRILGIKMQSIVVMAECTCENCGFEFFQTLPIGHTVGHTVSIDKSSGKVLESDENLTWLSKALEGFSTICNDEVTITKYVYKKCKDIIILNTLDFLYGHVLLKLYNALFHLDHNKDLGLVVIVPKSFEWLIPRGCAEAWIVDLPLGQLARRHVGIENLVQNELERFDRIYLSNAYSHPEISQQDIARLTGIKAFELSGFSALPPAFTFVLREDRWWFGNILDYWIYRFARKFKFRKTGNWVLSARQDRLIVRTIRRIRYKIPHANFHVVGLGRKGGFSGYAIDERNTEVDANIETEWCRIYAHSHVVIGVHGSNMLLPTALAAGCVEILPEDRFGNMVQDLSVRYNDRRQLFLYRFADQYSSPESVAEKAVSIVAHYEGYFRNMCINCYERPADRPSLTSVLVEDDGGH